MAKRSLLVLGLIVAGCQSSSTSKVSPGADAATPSGGAGGQATGGSTSAGGFSGLGGTWRSAGGAGSGGTVGNGGVMGSGGANAGGGTGMAGATGGTQADASPDTASNVQSDVRSDARPDGLGQGGSAGAGGVAVGSGGIGSGAGGNIPEVGADVAKAGGDARSDLPADPARDGGTDTGAYTKPVPVPDGGTCPNTGHVTYTLTKSATPTADEQTAYAKITAAMDQAVAYYNCYTNITKAEVVEYDGSVKTADGNSNGTIRFGSDTSYMVLPTAMHEISHTVGVGTASKWRSFVAAPDGGTSGPWTGANAIAQRTALLPDGNQTYLVPNADTQHFWPYGLNYASEYKTEADLLGHCVMVMALRKDMGLQ